MTFALPAANNPHQLDPEDNTRWLANIGTPATMSAKAQGNLPITDTAGQWNNNTAGTSVGIIYEFAASQAAYDVSSETKLMLWHMQSNAPNRIQLDSVANAGVHVKVYCGTGSPPSIERSWYVGGNDTPMSASISGQYPFVIDLNDSSHDASSGTWDDTDVTTYSLEIDRFNMAGTATAWCYPGAMYILDTIKSSSSTPTFTGTSDWLDAVDLLQGTDYTDKLGSWIRKIGDVIFVDMPWRIGDNSTETDFDDGGLTVISPIANDAANPNVRATTQAFRVYLNLRNNVADTATFTGTYVWQTRAAWDFDQDDSAVVTFTSPTFRGMGVFTIGSSITGAATWDDVDPVITADTGVDIDGSTFKNQNGTHALQLSGGVMDIADMRFETYASAHAIEIDTAGTYEFDNIFFDQSGTNDVENTSGGSVTINVVNGGTVPTITNTGGGSVTTVNNNVTVSIHVTDDVGTDIENARVQAVATETVGTITSGDILLTGLTNSSGILETTTFNYEAAFAPSGVDISIKARQGSVSPYKVPATVVGVIGAAGFSTTIALQPDE